MRVSAGRAVKYATLPGIFPRLSDLLFSGFGPVVRLVGLICFMVGLLPRNHPIFAKENAGKYGLVSILAAAANNVTFEWKQLDKIIIFAVILCGTVMSAVYLVGMVFYLMTLPAFSANIFVTQYPDKDLAFMMLDRVFGVVDIFNSSVSQTQPFPNAFQVGLQQLFSFFSMGIFFIALFILLYHIVDIVYDVTQTGEVAAHMSDDVSEAYGGPDPVKGFTWLPIRFIVCFGLLLPLSQGLNSAQWITLYAAKYGSGLATNGWINFNYQMGNNPTGEGNANLVPMPSMQDSSGLLKSLILMRSCIEMNYWEYGDNAGSHFVRGFVVNGQKSKALFRTMQDRSRYVDVTNGQYFMDDQNSYDASPANIAAGVGGDPFIDMLTYSNMSDIHLVLGEKDDSNPDMYADYPGGVLPVCGEINIPVTGRTGEALFAAEGYLFAVMNILFEVNRPGITITSFEDNLYIAVLREYNRTSSLMKDFLVRKRTSGNPDCWYDDDNDGYDSLSEGSDSGEYLGKCTEPVLASYWQTLIDGYFGYAFTVPPYSAYDFLAGTDKAGDYDTNGYYKIGQTSFDALGKPNPLMITAGILDYGWGGAGLWYNKLAERNGSLYTAVAALPQINKYPLIMEQVKAEKQKTDARLGSDVCETYNPRKSGETSIHLPDEKNQFVVEEATALYGLCTQLYDTEGLAMTGISKTTATSNPVEAIIQSFFSEFKVFDIEKNYEVTPMAQLSAIGRAMVDKALLGIIASGGASAVGAAAHLASANGIDGADVFATSAGLASKTLMTFSLLGLTGGILLHYVLPFMPFVYFFFAVGRWVKVIFEAMVGVPLWALAHMRTPGPGLPGDAASMGYFLILEIFIRPSLTVLSLIGAFSIFSALAVGLNSTFSLISTNLFGVAPAASVNVTQLARGATDQLFLSLLYITLVYMIGTASFKLIDLIPDQIMRWSGAGVQSMGASDNSDDLLAQWEWEMPARIEAMTHEAGQMMDEVIYQPAKRIDDAEKAKKAAAAADEKAKQAAAAQNQDGGGDS